MTCRGPMWYAVGSSGRNMIVTMPRCRVAESHTYHGFHQSANEDPGRATRIGGWEVGGRSNQGPSVVCMRFVESRTRLSTHPHMIKQPFGLGSCEEEESAAWPSSGRIVRYVLHCSLPRYLACLLGGSHHSVLTLKLVPEIASPPSTVGRLFREAVSDISIPSYRYQGPKGPIYACKDDRTIINQEPLGPAPSMKERPVGEALDGAIRNRVTSHDAKKWSSICGLRAPLYAQRAMETP